MARKLRTLKGRAIYSKRKEIVEPVFGQIKECQGFKRFSFRGIKNVTQEWDLVCLTHNHLFRVIDSLVQAVRREGDEPLSIVITEAKGGQSCLPDLLIPITTPWAILTLRYGEIASTSSSEIMVSDDDSLSGLIDVLRRAGCHFFRAVGRFEIFLPLHF